MKLIIDIPDEDYDVILENANYYIEKCWGLPTVWSAIKNGKPYEEGMTFDYVHGYVDALNEDGEYKARPQGDRWGKWVISEIQCPNCLEYFSTDCYSTEELNKCPCCGAKIKGGKEND